MATEVAPATPRALVRRAVVDTPPRAVRPKLQVGLGSAGQTPPELPAFPFSDRKQQSPYKARGPSGHTEAYCKFDLKSAGQDADIIDEFLNSLEAAAPRAPLSATAFDAVAPAVQEQSLENSSSLPKAQTSIG